MEILGYIALFAAVILGVRFVNRRISPAKQTDEEYTHGVW